MAKRQRTCMNSSQEMRTFACDIVGCRLAFQSLKSLRLHKQQARSENHEAARQKLPDVLSNDHQYSIDTESEADSPSTSEYDGFSGPGSPPTASFNQDSTPPRTFKRPRVTRVTVEEVEDEDVHHAPSPSPQQASPPVELDGLPHPSAIWVEALSDDEDIQAGKTYGRCQTSYDKYEAKLAAAGFDPATWPWAVFENETESEIGLWLAGASNLSQGGIDDFLKLPSVRQHLKLSYKNKSAFFKKIDQIPRGPGWMCKAIPVKGDETNEKGERVVVDLELWHRNALDCIRELMGNPAFKSCARYAPERHFVNTTEGGVQEVFEEMWSGRLWSELQNKLPKGATVAPIIISSDETHLTTGHGDKSAWPVYLSIGNIAKGTRRQVSSGATVLLGYIPVSDFEFCSKENRRRAERTTFHRCMRYLLESLIEAGKEGVMMDCADGFIRWVFPILAAYIADYPEQQHVTCTVKNWCPRCTVHKSHTGEPVAEHVTMRDLQTTLEAILLERDGIVSKKAEDEGIETLAKPFWSDLPHCDIFSAITPDLLHQIHNGIFKHIVKWTTACLPGKSPAERDKDLDLRLINMPKHRALRHFLKGTSFISQWTGEEMKEMERVFLGAIAESCDEGVLTAVRAVLDMTFYASFRVHTTESVQLLAEAWSTFHDAKNAFLKLGARKHFKWIPKLHMPSHYPSSIYTHGSFDGYNTELPERLHIDFAKKAYRASNKRDYKPQMTRWLERHEACHQLEVYLQWRHPGFYKGITARRKRVQVSSSPQDSELGDLEGAWHSGAEVVEEARDGDDDDDGGNGDGNAPTNAPAGDRETTHTLSVRPRFPGLMAHAVVAQFGATDFAHYVHQYLGTLPTIRARTSPDTLLQANTAFQVYALSQLTYPIIRQATDVPIHERVHACPPAHKPRRRCAPLYLQGTQTLADPYYFSTVLVRENDVGNEHGAATLKDLRVGQIRVIFRLPSEFAPYDSTPLAYIQWFTRFQVYDNVLGMWSVRPSFHMGSRRASIVPLRSVVRACHLIPHSLRKRQPVHDSERSFFLNPYITLSDFVLLRHLPSCVLTEGGEDQEDEYMQVE